MTHYHAVLLDECGMEFGAGVNASSRGEAYSELEEMYPESRVIQLESPEDTARREQAIYARIMDDDYDYQEDF